MKTYSKIYKANTYLSSKVPTTTAMWVLANTPEHARGRIFSLYPYSNITTISLIFKQILCIDKCTIGSSIFEVKLSTGPDIFIPSIYVVSDCIEETIKMCMDQYFKLMHIDIEPVNGIVVPDSVRGNTYGL